MFRVIDSFTVSKNPDFYISFPDIIQDPTKENHLFLTFREADKHHPTWSNLVLLESRDGGKKWKKIGNYSLSLQRHGMVWNCPRLSYLNNELCIICDTKSSQTERTASFSTYIIRIGLFNRFRKHLIEMPGMVPDKIVKFKNNFYCANHKIKSVKNDLIQLMSWSRNNGETWYDTNILAHDDIKQFCEASVVNINDDYLIAYLRDNSGHKRKIWYTTSEDGIYWLPPVCLDIYGQRPTAIYDNKEILCGYRNTKDHKVSIFVHNLKEDKITNYDVDWEMPENQYHFGYTGLCKCGHNKYALVYYIKNLEKNPFIKISILDR